MTELRSFNVASIYNECVLCRIGNSIGVKSTFYERKNEIVEMVSQLSLGNHGAPLNVLHKRTDGEQWTPYLQMVEILILMAYKLNIVTFTGKLKASTIIKLKNKNYGKENK